MISTSVYIVHLRRPNRNDPTERRSDPFYEFGSFGCTGCHSRNLMNRKHRNELKGARFAFAQGGPLGFRLVYLTPPIDIISWEDITEARWSPHSKPFCYEKAPVLAWNERKSDFPAIEGLASSTARSTIEGGFSSLFRSRTSPLEDGISKELIRTYERFHKNAMPNFFAERYSDALPFQPPLIDSSRRATYKKLIGTLRDEGTLGPTKRCRDAASNVPGSVKKC